MTQDKSLEERFEDSQSPKDDFAKGISAYNGRNYSKAVEHLTEFLEHGKFAYEIDKFDASFHLADSLRRLGKYDKAMKIARKIVRSLGECEERKKAESLIDKCYLEKSGKRNYNPGRKKQEDPNAYLGCNEIGRQYIKIRQYAKAIGEFKKSIKLRPNCNPAVGLLFDAYVGSGKLTGALDYFSRFQDKSYLEGVIEEVLGSQSPHAVRKAMQVCREKAKKTGITFVTYLKRLIKHSYKMGSSAFVNNALEVCEEMVRANPNDRFYKKYFRKLNKRKLKNDAR